MIKAGIMEIADVFVVNKADLPGSQRTVQEIRSMLNMGPKLDWKPPIVSVVAARQEGIEELFGAITKHRRFLETSGAGRLAAEQRLKDEAADLVGEWARSEARRLLDEDGPLAQRLLSDQVPYPVAEEILSRGGDDLVPDSGAASEGKTAAR